MTIVFESVHSDDLDQVGTVLGGKCGSCKGSGRKTCGASVPVSTINHKRVLARADALTQESIRRSKEYADRTGAGKEN